MEELEHVQKRGLKGDRTEGKLIVYYKLGRVILRVGVGALDILKKLGVLFRSQNNERAVCVE